MKAHLCIAGLAIIISFSLVYQQSNGVYFTVYFSLCFLMEILNTVVENLVDLLVKRNIILKQRRQKILQLVECYSALVLQ